jgi:hypothetical protein
MRCSLLRLTSMRAGPSQTNGIPTVIRPATRCTFAVSTRCAEPA